MKISWKNSTVNANRWRCGVTWLAAVCIVCAVFISSSAQLKGAKHVTSVEMVQLAEGARVTVNADSTLSDYEAFRRGDRFYVKIPLAEFSFSQPRFKGNGFDNVQVEKVGDSVVVSFKLQLGECACGTTCEQPRSNFYSSQQRSERKRRVEPPRLFGHHGRQRKPG
jgi:hypothetical protein